MLSVKRGSNWLGFKALQVQKKRKELQPIEAGEALCYMLCLIAKVMTQTVQASAVMRVMRTTTVMRATTVRVLRIPTSVSNKCASSRS